MAKTVECFYPGSSFPAISITGKSCSLNCKHCGRKYLEGMVPVQSPQELLGLAEVLAERGANGFLLSGGADSTGKVRLCSYCDAIKQIKETTELKVNAHVGLSSADELRKLVQCGIDAFSLDLYGSDDTIHEVLGLDARTEDYLSVLTGLRKAGARIIAPHICVGIHAGELRGERAAIESLRTFEPDVLVLISLMPTKGTPYEDVKAPSGDVMRSLIAEAREELPVTKLLLGCMRSKIDRSHEADLVLAGLDGIVLPSVNTVESLKRAGYIVRKRAVCCAFV